MEIEEENYTKRAVRGTGIILSFTMVALFFGYLLRLLLARNLTVEEYGLFFAVFTLFTFIVLLKDMGLTRVIARFIPEFKVKKRYDLIKNSFVSVFSFQFILSAVVTLTFIIFSEFIAINYFHNINASLVIKLLAIAFWLKPLVLICSGVFQGFQKMGHYASIDLIRSILVLVLSFIGFQISKGLVVPSLAYLITSMLLLFIFIPILLKKVFPEFFKEKFVIDKKLIKKLFNFGILTMVGVISWLIVGYIDVFVLIYFSGLEQVGLYNASLPTAMLISYFGLTLATVILPIITELWTKKSNERLISGVKLLYKYSFALVIPFALIMFCFPELILGLLFGKNYILASNSLRILSLGFIMLTISRVNFDIILGIGKPEINARIAIIALLFNLILNLILIAVFGLGIVGASITAFLTFFIMLFLSLSSLRKFMGIQIPIWPWFKSICAGAIFALVILLLRKLFVLNPYTEVILVSGIGGLVYCGLLFVFRIISIQEVKNLLKRILTSEGPYSQHIQ